MGIDNQTDYEGSSAELEVQWQEFVKSQFEAAGLPEVDPSQLETGTYTNAQIAEKFRGRPEELRALLNRVPRTGNEAEKRNILSLIWEAGNLPAK